MQSQISWLPERKPFNWRLFLIIASFVCVAGLIAFECIRLQFDGGFPVVNGVVQVDLKSLGDFSFDEYRGTMQDIPKRFAALDGKKVALEGFMYTGRSSSANIPDFQFVYNAISHGPPLVQQRIFVYAAKDVPYVEDECQIIGTLHVKVVRDQDSSRVQSIFTMDLDHVERP